MSNPPGPTPAPRSADADHPPEGIKDTLISIVIAFALAFVFRGFVVEAFVIPTGSMAPTLLGAHMQFTGAESGYTWAVGPWDYYGGPGSRRQEPRPLQGTQLEPVRVHDPMTGDRAEGVNIPRRSGDRILVLKYIYLLQEPSRFDVIVFKDPANPAVNFIKRLLGLPGEEVALIDGDVFIRPADNASTNGSNDRWSLNGWRVARKPLAVQREVWQPVFDSIYSPVVHPDGTGRVFTPPWVGTTPGWRTEGRRTYDYDGDRPTRLEWNNEAIMYSEPRVEAEPWQITDRYPYNESRADLMVGRRASVLRFNESDIRMRAGIEPRAASLLVRATLAARRHEFQAVLSGGTATLRVRGGVGTKNFSSEFREVLSAQITPLEPGRVTNVHFAHADQALELWVDGERVLRWEYDWTPAERVFNASGKTIAALLEDGQPNLAGPFAEQETFDPARLWWEFEGGGVTMHRVALDRDLHYQAAVLPGDIPGRATHPSNPITLNNDQFFVCGDNSPASSDSRLWIQPDPWVSDQIDPTPGVVPRKLLVGKAFFVYFPSLHGGGIAPVPDFGRMRFIR